MIKNVENISDVKIISNEYQKSIRECQKNNVGILKNIEMQIFLKNA